MIHADTTTIMANDRPTIIPVGTADNDNAANPDSSLTSDNTKGNYQCKTSLLCGCKVVVIVLS